MKSDEIFLPHLSEPLRREIAVNYAQHELRKLLPQLREASLWKSIDEQTEKWYEELSIRNFYNGIHGISMGFRLKSLVPWITSLNVQWTKKEITIDELWFGGKFVHNVPSEIPELANAIKAWIFLSENKKILEQAKEKLKEESEKTASRDDFSIFVVRKDDGKLRVIDGNRRLLQAIVTQKDTILAAVGEPVATPALYEHWVSTALLVDLVFWHKRQVKLGRETTDAVARVIAELIRDSSAGRSEFLHRGVHHNEEVDMRLLKAVAEILHSYSISFEVPKT